MWFLSSCDQWISFPLLCKYKIQWSFLWKWATWEIFNAGHAGDENELLFFGWSSILGTPTVPLLFGFRRERPSFSHISLLMFFVASQPKLCQSSFWKILSFFHFINLVLIFKYILNFEAWCAQYLLLLSFSLPCWCNFWQDSEILNP